MKLFLGITLLSLALLVGYCSMDGEPAPAKQPLKLIARCKLEIRQDCIDSIEDFCPNGYEITKESVVNAPGVTFLLYEMEATCK